MRRTQSPRITKIWSVLISDDLEPDAIYIDVNYIRAGGVRIDSPTVERNGSVDDRSTVNVAYRASHWDNDRTTTQ